VKLIYPGVRNLAAKWSRPSRNWSEASLELAIHYGQRYSAGMHRPS
jgi:transposase-like protein